MDKPVYTLQDETRQTIKELRINYGWYWLIEEVSKYAGVSYYEQMERTALESFSLILVMMAKIEYNKLTQNVSTQKS